MSPSPSPAGPSASIPRSVPRAPAWLRLMVLGVVGLVLVSPLLEAWRRGYLSHQTDEARDVATQFLERVRKWEPVIGGDPRFKELLPPPPAAAAGLLREASGYPTSLPPHYLPWLSLLDFGHHATKPQGASAEVWFKLKPHGRPVPEAELQYLTQLAEQYYRLTAHQVGSVPWYPGQGRPMFSGRLPEFPRDPRRAADQLAEQFAVVRLARYGGEWRVRSFVLPATADGQGPTADLENLVREAAKDWLDSAKQYLAASEAALGSLRATDPDQFRSTWRRDFKIARRPAGEALAALTKPPGLEFDPRRFVGEGVAA
jgi:hypothetical protein